MALDHVARSPKTDNKISLSVDIRFTFLKLLLTFLISVLKTGTEVTVDWQKNCLR